MRIAKWLAAATLATLPAAPLLAQAMTSADYLAKAGAGDQYEIGSSKLVAQSTTNPSLKRFAAMMVTDHTKSTAMVKAAATKARLRPKPPVLTPEQQSNLAALRAATGAERDALYLSQQKAAHQEALALHQDEAANGTAAPLKAAASEIVPVVEHHIGMLDSM